MCGPASKAGGVALALMAGILAAGAAHAQDPADGRRIAQRWCSSCHVVAPGAGGSDAARPFEAVANDPNFTPDGARAWLADPHPPMPNLALTREEIEAVIGYIASLRRE